MSKAPVPDGSQEPPSGARVPAPARPGPPLRVTRRSPRGGGAGVGTEVAAGAGGRALPPSLRGDPA